MKWLELATYTLDKNKNLLITLHDDYNKALLKLDEFSHSLLFFLRTSGIDCCTVKHLEIDISKGQLTVEICQNHKIEGQLVDIKPYFPNEEVIKSSISKENRYITVYKNDFIGEYRVDHHQMFIELQDQVHGHKNFLNDVEVGDHIRVLWWFHRFDKSNYRRSRVCNPPYNNAPKTGIFASRSPVRPNPIGSTLVEVEDVDLVKNRIYIKGFDGFSGSKIFQLMNYQADFDCVKEVTTPKWVSHWTPYKSFEIAKTINQEKKIEVVKQTDYELDILSQASESDDFVHDEIQIHNAYIHNLKNISVTIPKNEVTLITGVSGSGKSSLAFDTLFSESQKHFMDLILSNDLDSKLLTSGKVEKISGLQPAIAIKQKNMGLNPRSTVGSVTRIADIIKLIFSKLGVRICPMCHEIVDDLNVCSCGHIMFDISPQLFSYNHPDFMCPVCKGLGLEMQIDENLIVDNPNLSLLDKASSLYGDLRKHAKKPNANWMRGEVLALAIDLGVDLELPYNQLPAQFRREFLHGSQGRVVSLSYENSKGRSGVISRPVEGALHLVHRLAYDSKSNKGLENMNKYMSKSTCSRCQGERLREEGRLVRVLEYRYPDVMKMSIKELRRWCHLTYAQLDESNKIIALQLFRKLNSRLTRIESVGLSYISLDRSIPSLSGGEAQRLKLASQFGTGLSNILYIMDEPSKGLHPKDYAFLMDAIEDLKNHNNTIVLVEHKESFKRIANQHIIMGPKAGKYGGEITSLTRQDQLDYQDDHDDIIVSSDMKNNHNYINMIGVKTNNLKNISVSIPIGQLTAVIGVSGSGKSSLISKTLYPYLMKIQGEGIDELGHCHEINGTKNIENITYVNQKPIGSNSRSNPATYTGVFEDIRKCYSSLEESKRLGLKKEHFSFNSKKGQCTECKGLGEVKVDMYYMDDVYIPCSSCRNKRYNEIVLSVKRKGYSIGQILDMEIGDLLDVFIEENDIYDKLKMLLKVGLGYLKLGQSASTLSGGEAQRIKLSKELCNKSCKDRLYILDEPTTGLHKEDVTKIIEVLRELKEKGATIIVIEHNMQVIKVCDYAIELGPSGGDMGGRLVRQGYIYRTNQ